MNQNYVHIEFKTTPESCIKVVDFEKVEGARSSKLGVLKNKS